MRHGGSQVAADDGQWSNPRLVIPMVSYTSSTGTILGFGVFFIDACGTNGAIIGRFIDTMVPGRQWIPLSGGSSYGAGRPAGVVSNGQYVSRAACLAPPRLGG